MYVIFCQTITTVEVGSLSHDLQGLLHPRWWSPEFWAIHRTLDIQGHRNCGSVWLDPKKHTIQTPDLSSGGIRLDVYRGKKTTTIIMAGQPTPLETNDC